MAEFDFKPRFEFHDGEPDNGYWNKEMHGILIHAMDGLTKKKQQDVYNHIVALMHMAYRHGYARGCHAGAGDALNYKSECDDMPLDFGALMAARKRLEQEIEIANHKDDKIVKILEVMESSEE